MNIPCPRIPHPRMADTVTATLSTHPAQIIGQGRLRVKKQLVTVRVIKSKSGG
jgi:hypothetical protein